MRLHTCPGQRREQSGPPSRTQRRCRFDVDMVSALVVARLPQSAHYSKLDMCELVLPRRGRGFSILEMFVRCEGRDPAVHKARIAGQHGPRDLPCWQLFAAGDR